jgi:hypothetical protein
VLAVDYSPDDAAGGDFVPQAHQEQRKPEIAREENNAVNRNLRPQSERRPRGIRQVDEVRLDPAPSPEDRRFVPPEIEIARKLQAFVDHHEDVHIRMFMELFSSPRTEGHDADQILSDDLSRSSDGPARHFPAFQTAKWGREFAGTVLIQRHSSRPRRLTEGGVKAGIDPQDETARTVRVVAIYHFDIICHQNDTTLHMASQESLQTFRLRFSTTTKGPVRAVGVGAIDELRVSE